MEVSQRSVAPKRDEPLRLDVIRINVLQILDIDHVGQKFSAHMFCQFRLANGAKDKDLVRDLDDENPTFPKDSLRPGAAWLMRQIDFPTAHEYSIKERKVVVIGSHIDIVLKVHGVFFEVMELENFPVDVQELTIVVSISVANEGVCPVKICNLLSDGGDVIATVNSMRFAMSNMWDLSSFATLSHRLLEPMERTSYPALAITAFAARRQGYYIFNVVLPLGTLQALALLQFLLPGQYIRVADRIAFSVTLLLTSAAYKLFVSASLPDINYLTLIDRYVLYNFFCQTGMIIPSVILGFFRREELPVSPFPCLAPCDTNASAITNGEYADLSLMAAFFLLFVVLHAWIASRYITLRARKTQLIARHDRLAATGEEGNASEEDTFVRDRAAAYRETVMREAQHSTKLYASKSETMDA